MGSVSGSYERIRCGEPSTLRNVECSMERARVPVDMASVFSSARVMTALARLCRAVAGTMTSCEGIWTATGSFMIIIMMSTTSINDACQENDQRKMKGEIDFESRNPEGVRACVWRHILFFLFLWR